MPHIFDIIRKDANARIGKLKTPHGIVETPTVMPVINPNIRIIDPSKMRKFGAEILIANSYIIYRNEKLASFALEKGLHELIGFDGPIMTDSGSFQLSVYGEVEINNIEVIKFQQEIGSDIGVPLDIPTPPFVSRSRAESELETTLNRLREAKDYTQKTDSDMLLSGPIQGSTYTDLRGKSAREVSDIGFDLYPIGAVVPLMESYRYKDLVNVIAASKNNLSKTAPVHLFGAGHPMIFALAVSLGVDLFDSAAYALYAKDGRYITTEGTHHLSNLNYLPCVCPICSSHTANEFKSAKNYKELLAQHNLFVTFAEIRHIKQAIRDGNLLELVELRCRAHPYLLDGLKEMYAHSSSMELFDPASKSTFFYCGPESANRPEILRFKKRMNRFTIEGSAIIRIKSSNEDEKYDNVLTFKPPFGSMPSELDEVYPFNAEVVKEHDYESINSALLNTLQLIQLNPNAKFTFVIEKKHLHHPLMEEIKKKAEVIEYISKF